MKEGVLKRWNSRVKPILKEDNKVARVLYCIEEIYPVRARTGTTTRTSKIVSMLMRSGSSQQKTYELTYW